MRGFNLSDKPSDVAQYRLSVLVEDIRAFADHLAPGKKFVLVGHDWGGFVAWAFAIPIGRAEKLVIINAPHPAVFACLLTFDPAQQKASEYMDIFRSHQAEQILSANNFDILANKVMVSARKMACCRKTSPHTSKPGHNPARSPAVSILSRQSTQDVAASQPPRMLPHSCQRSHIGHLGRKGSCHGHAKPRWPRRVRSAN